MKFRIGRRTPNSDPPSWGALSRRFNCLVMFQTFFFLLTLPFLKLKFPFKFLKFHFNSRVPQPCGNFNVKTINKICMEEKAGGWQAFPFSIQIFKLSNRAKIAHLNVGGLKICNNANLHHDLFVFFLPSILYCDHTF